MVDFNFVYSQLIPKLERDLPDFLCYHNVAHTLDVLHSCLLIAENEDIDPLDLKLIQTAALYHDAGFLVQAENHEEIGCAMVREELPGFGFSKDQVEKVCGMIMGTKIPQAPMTILERVVADADLEYLGTDQFDEKSRRLYQEMKHFDPALNGVDWLKIQIDFLERHSYHTHFCIANREQKKQENLQKLKVKLAELTAGQ
ncbi:HD domain-containing protein [Litoribacter populi]|uniref:HD domain-containing protein n=1 Tax=Litoribacter populi TaxID=2598460 RepID=UPI00117DF5A9|nr:HD domain-containing protein [Litoribacter populi]